MPHLPGQFFLRNLIERRTLLFQLVRRDFEQRFVGSAIGWLWGLIHPLVLLLCWTFVFQWCLKIRPDPNEIIGDSYAMFMFTGFLPWLLFQETVQRSASSLLENANLITKTVFPSEVVPVSIFLSSLVGHLMALAMALLAVGVWQKQFSFMVLLLPAYMLLLGLFAVGIGWIAASLQVYLRDTAQVISITLTAWFWLTPIFISEKQFPDEVRFLITLNPLAYVVHAYRERILTYRPPDLNEFAAFAAFAVVAFVIGGLFFRHLKRGFADVL
jgi:ABC-type polysaccharide/polyol phosphate export permease